jgi:5-formyltetrahydrofolate cyclo-ligase
MLKKEARKLFREKRAQLSAQERSKLDDLMLIQLQQAGIPPLQAVLSFWPIESNNEPDTHLFTRFMAFQNPGMILAYPVTDLITGTMEAVEVNEATRFVCNEWGIWEPASGNVLSPEVFDLILVPLLAFDEEGNRAGYGKGFYDRYLAQCREDALRVGFSHFEPVEALGDCHEFDVPLSLCITPHQTYVF